jgi:hypothetical protein
VLAVGLAAAGGALLIANALDSPVGEGARDEARAVVEGPVAVPGVAGGAQGLQPLALFPDEPLPAEIASLPPIRRAERLAERARSDPDPRWLVQLGSVLQVLGDPDGARTVYREALRREPESVAARAGLVMVEGAGGAAGLERAAAGLEQLAREHPRDQLVAFNQGIVEVYRGRAAAVAAAWRRTADIDPESYLGRSATEGLAQLAAASGGRAP